MRDAEECARQCDFFRERRQYQCHAMAYREDRARCWRGQFGRLNFDVLYNDQVFKLPEITVPLNKQSGFFD